MRSSSRRTKISLTRLGGSARVRGMCRPARGTGQKQKTQMLSMKSEMKCRATPTQVDQLR